MQHANCPCSQHADIVAIFYLLMLRCMVVMVVDTGFPTCNFDDDLYVLHNDLQHL